MNRLTFSSDGEPLDREDLFRDIARGITDKVASVPERLYGEGPIYIAINTFKNNTDVKFIARKSSAAKQFLQASSGRQSPAEVDNSIAGRIDGNEYCVRPSLFSSGSLIDVNFYLPAGGSGQLGVYDSKGRVSELRSGKSHFQISNVNTAPVSYTHLTLPTILLV